MAEPRSGGRRYWLIKSEPSVFSFDDLLAAPRRTTSWDGVRNYAARNFMRDGMKKGDRCFFYHSNAEPPCIAGVCEVVKEGYPDKTAFDPSDSHYDPRSKVDSPTWYMVDVKAVKPLRNPVSLAVIKADSRLAEMALLCTSRLSVVPVTAKEWRHLCKLGGVEA